MSVAEPSEYQYGAEAFEAVYRPLQTVQHQYSREDRDDEKAGFGLSLLGAI